VLLQRCLTDESPGGLARRIIDVADRSARLDESRERMAPLLGEFAQAADTLPRPLIFFPDFEYIAEPQVARSNKPAISPKQPHVEPDDQAEPRADETAESDQPSDARRDEDLEPAAYVYPEWNQNENDYYEDWCYLHERVPRLDPNWRLQPNEEQDRMVAHVRRMFERLRPELSRKQKYLEHGDEINVDLLVEFLTLKHRLPNPRVRFYEKTFVKKRDLAVALLLDVSGSTAGFPEDVADAGAPQQRVIDLEKRAALILAEGLAALGDPFGIYGFSGSGRERCVFFVYKDIHEAFSDHTKRRLAMAHPLTNTRIGVALRHCRAKLADHPARRKIVIVITDGKPQDADYDPTGRYAQHDVRMACQEAERTGVHTVCISTQENSRADLEIMFPHQRFVILDDMRRLAHVLPKLYLNMTT